MAAADFAAQNVLVETLETLRDRRVAPSTVRLAAIIVAGETIADLLTCAVGFAAAYLLHQSFSSAPLTQQLSNQIFAVSFCFAISFTFLGRRDGANPQDAGILQIRESERNIRVVLQSLALTQILSILLRLDLSVFVTLIAAIIVSILLVIQKRAFFRAAKWLRERYQSDLRVLVYGAGDTARAIASALVDSPRLGLNPIAIIHDGDRQHASLVAAVGYSSRASIPILTNLITPEFLQSFHADLLLIANANISSERIAATKDAAKVAQLNVGELMRIPAVPQQRALLLAIDGFTLALTSEHSASAFYAHAKRMVDLVFSVVLLITLAPLLVAIALLIRIDSPGPALFVQKRVGKDGTVFLMYKFRTMYFSTPPYELSPTTSKDRRITQIGRSLRRFSLDELPQLLNVLLGEMSLVGPRPEMPFIVQHYTTEEIKRLEAIPGISGLWQLSADRAFPIHQNIQYDLYYIRNRNLSMDFAILIHTLLFALRSGI